MDQLIEFGNSGRVRDLVGSLLGNEAALGVVIDVDPMWLAASRLRAAGMEALAERTDLFWLMLSGARRWPWLGATSRRSTDYSWIPHWWSRYRQDTFGKFGEDHPFIVKVCLWDAADQKELPLFSSERFGLPIVIERRTRAGLASQKRAHRPLIGGVSGGSGSGNPFTIGGIVKSVADTYYGVTCGHCAEPLATIEQPSAVDGRTTKIGTVVRQVAPMPSPFGAICNPWAPGPLNEVDVALIELTSPAQLEVLSIGRITGVVPRSALSPGDRVDISGRTSGHRVLEIGGLAVTYKFDDHGSTFCFTNLFELRHTYGKTACQLGDSGSWACRPVALNAAAWAGMVIGADSLIGFGVFAETIESWWHDEGFSLVVC